MQNAVGIDVENDFDLGDTSGSRGYSVKVEPSDALVLVCHGAFTLKYVDLNRSLAIRSSRKHFGFFCRNGSIRFYKFCHDTAEGFNTERKRGNVKKKNILNLTG